MQFRTIVSAFYLDAATTPPDLAALVRRVGVRDARALGDDDRRALGFGEPGRVILGGAWGVFQETWAALDVVEGLLCLQLYSPYGRFLDAMVNDDRQNGPEPVGPTSMTYVETFAESCGRLAPTAAMLDARAHYELAEWRAQRGTRGWVLAQAPLVAGGDVDALAEERVSVLYLSAPLLLRWESSPSHDDRDTVELPSGRLIFARRGPAWMA
jgi:hypothetical protein